MRRVYSKKLEDVGFERGKGSGVVFYNQDRDVSCVCHGDDFTLVGEVEELRWVARMMETWFEIKVRGVLGPEVGDDKEIVILGRTVRWTKEGVEFEADRRHRNVLMDHFRFEEGAKGAGANGDKERKEEGKEDDDEMDKEEAKKFRGMVARMNYVAQDAPDLQYPAKEMSREMAKPKRGAWRRLKWETGGGVEVWLPGRGGRDDGQSG